MTTNTDPRPPTPRTKRGLVLLNDLRSLIPRGLWTPFREEQIAGSIAAIESEAHGGGSDLSGETRSGASLDGKRAGAAASSTQALRNSSLTVEERRAFRMGWAEAATAERERLEYGETWERWERFADMAARAGSGFTQDQMTGAAAMLTWLTDHEAEAATAERERAERRWTDEEVKRAIRLVTDNDSFDLGYVKECARLADAVIAALSDPTGGQSDE